MKKAVVTFLKLGIPAGLFVYLLFQVNPEDYRAFWSQPKRWELLALAQLVSLTAIVLSFFRWRLLVLAFEIPFTLKEALRLGFLGYLLNFVSFGSVGGDVFKAILVARDKPERRPEAVASVLLDRALGLLGLVLLACFSLYLLTGNTELSSLMRGIRDVCGVVAAIAVAGLCIAIFAGGWFDRWIDLLARIPLAGDALARMARAVRLLRKTPGTVVVLLAYSVCVQTMLALTMFLVSAGAYPTHPTLVEHLMVVPPGMAAGALPLAPGGLGYQEGALAGLFKQLPNLPPNFSGILVATIYRLVTITIAGIGLIYYWSSHGREFQFATKASRHPVPAPSETTSS